ncbi:MAG: SDR family NAD(P)-dependent oxidoreductase [Malacoplasma sp.]|nr:SDR family NAD(P)-dependent oxidoreductase [Malacoplasma sp.]
MENNFDKKIAIISGASSGIGLAVGNLLASKNYLVYSLSRSKPNSPSIFHLQCDISDFKKVKQYFEQVFEKHKKIDLVINNSGYALVSSWEELKIDEYEKLMRVNVESAFNICEIAIDYLQKSKGKIINIGSTVSEIFVPFEMQYCLSKQLLKIVNSNFYNICKLKNIGICYLILGKIKTDFDKNRKINLDENSLYKVQTNNLMKKLNSSLKFGINKDKVAKYVYKLVEKKNIKKQKIMGIKNKILVFIFKLFSWKFKAKFLYKYFCKK